MGWKEQRISDLENRLVENVNLLGDVEKKLIYEDDPRTIGKLKSQVIELKKQKDEHSKELESYGEHENIPRMMTDVNFEDLNFVITGLLRQQGKASSSHNTYVPTKPEEKMSKNGLTSEIRMLLNSGLMEANEVRNLIENLAKIDLSDIAEKLKSTLNYEYNRLTNQGVRGNDLFEQLHEFSSCNSADFKRKMAGLAVLCYFFETCDIFEP